MPFFSILLPTKNRSHLVGNAIQSILQQDFEDFEIIVCDNDDDESATRSAVHKFSDNRIKYIRTGGLDMVANWNCALDAATGDNVTVLEDKMIFYPEALSGIKTKIEQSSTGVVVWYSDILDDNHVPNRLVQFLSSGQKNVASNEILGLVTKDAFKHWSLLPRGLSCVIPGSVILEIINQSSSNFYEPFSPDFVSAIKILAHVDEILAVYKAYTLVTSTSLSVGNNALLAKEGALKYYSGQNVVGFADDFVSVKNTSIVVNSVVNDFRWIAAKNGGSIKGFQIENKNYVKMMTRDLIISTFLAKKFRWDKSTLLQLVGSEGQVFRNLLYIVSYACNFTIVHLLNKVGLGKTHQKKKVSLIKSDPLDSLALFLSGEDDLGSAKRFPLPKNQNI